MRDITSWPLAKSKYRTLTNYQTMQHAYKCVRSRAGSLKESFSNFNAHRNHLEILLKCGLWLSRSALSPSISNKLPLMLILAHR